jgi:4-hydroxy-tetrahydrodipicolinate reductase
LLFKGADVPVKVVQVGLGPIGTSIVREMTSRPALQLVGAVDVDPGKIGRDLGSVSGLRRRLGVAVSGDLARTCRTLRPDVAVLCTGSSLRQVLPELEIVLKAKVPIVSTTEELVYPVKHNTALAKRIDTLAKRGRVAVLGTGVNPGFVMDALAIALTAVCTRVEAIEIDRVQDARVRRLPFQQKIGAGLTVEEFQLRAKAGVVRHVGLSESITMIADAMGWRIDRIAEDIRPHVAEEPVSSGLIDVERGRVAGLVQDAVGYAKGKALVTLHMEAYLGAPAAYDAIRVLGTPPLSMRLDGGVHGDIATAAIVVNSIPKVLAAAPGLRTMREIALPSFSGRQRR